MCINTKDSKLTFLQTRYSDQNLSTKWLSCVNLIPKRQNWNRITIVFTDASLWQISCIIIILYKWQQREVHAVNINILNKTTYFPTR